MDAPKVQLSDAETRELRRMAAEMDSVRFTKHTYVEAGRGRGGDLEVIPGSAGAPVFGDILAAHPNQSSATRREVQAAIEGTLEGKRTALSEATIDVARKRLAGDRSVSRPILPPEAGDVIPAGGGGLAGTADEGFDRFAHDVQSLSQLGGPSEPGEAGRINAQLLARGGLGTAGAAYGAATGEDTQDRLKRAALFGAAGALAPSPGQGR